MDELICLVESLEFNDVFHRYGSWEKIGGPGKALDFSLDKVPFHKDVLKGLGYSHMIPLFLPDLHHLLIDGNSFVSVVALVQLCFNTFSGHLLEMEDDKAINLSEILPPISFFVEDFDNLDLVIPEYDEKFFEHCIIFAGRINELKN